MIKTINRLWMQVRISPSHKICQNKKNKIKDLLKKGNYSHLNEYFKDLTFDREYTERLLIFLMRNLEMRTACNRSNVNIEEKEIKYKPDNLIMVSGWNKKMSCLKCGEKFFSKGLYNRICEECNLTNERTMATTYSLSLEFAEITDRLEGHKFDFYYILNSS